MIMRALMTFLMLHVILEANALQNAIDSADEGSVIRLKAGVYRGAISITKPLTILGTEKGVIIDGEGEGTIVTINSPYVTLKNLTLRHSGSRHDKLDAAISITDSKQCEVSHCVIEDALFGIDIKMSHNILIEYNTISSKDVDLGLRGDGLRLWYSNDNIIRHNRLINSRDMVVWYSHGNRIEENFATHCRYSLHFMYAGKNYVRNNHYEFNSVGIFFMYSKDTIATGNVIKSSLGATGMGIGLKDVSNFTLQNNTVLYNAQGIYIDRSPFEPGTYNNIRHNNILYNAEALHFHSLSENNIIQDNTIVGNIEDVVNDARGSKTDNNVFVGNYWDTYEGFDRDGDLIGDTPHKIYQYADKLWLYHPEVKFFYGSPVIALLNFLAKLAPFSEPVFLLSDEKPRLKKGV